MAELIIEKKELYIRYYRYIDVIEKIAYNRNSKITLDNIGVSEAVKQSCYKEIRELKAKGIFKGTLIEYLIYISMNHFFYEYMDNLKLITALSAMWKKKISLKEQKELAVKLTLDLQMTDRFIAAISIIVNEWLLRNIYQQLNECLKLKLDQNIFAFAILQIYESGEKNVLLPDVKK